VHQTAVPQTWDIQADVVVVGFGAAGACAALEAAAAGRDVVVLDRFADGGATALSGGVIYPGAARPTSSPRACTTRPRPCSAT
jgi:3-oxo-5alpha-steroid 4-dehydrogenase